MDRNDAAVAWARPVSVNQRTLDRADPWGGPGSKTSIEASAALPDKAVASPSRSGLENHDASDKKRIEPKPEAVEQIAQGTKSPQATADTALTGAIKTALDAGDVERAAKLLDILRGKR